MALLELIGPRQVGDVVFGMVVADVLQRVRDALDEIVLLDRCHNSLRGRCPRGRILQRPSSWLAAPVAIRPGWRRPIPPRSQGAFRAATAWRCNLHPGRHHDPDAGCVYLMRPKRYTMPALKPTL